MLTFLDRPDAFTAAECDAIVALALGSALEPATVYDGVGDRVDPRQRQAERCYWPRATAGGWIHWALGLAVAHSISTGKAGATGSGSTTGTTSAVLTGSAGASVISAPLPAVVAQTPAEW